jgi:membrane protein YdbS with pleckstrin-like domain
MKEYSLMQLTHFHTLPAVVAAVVVAVVAAVAAVVVVKEVWRFEEVMYRRYVVAS